MYVSIGEIAMVYIVGWMVAYGNTETIKFTLIECLLNEPVTVHFLLDMV